MTARISHLCVRNLCARYASSGPYVSKNINFEVSAGEVMAIMGPSGAGKSTLLKAVLGLIPERTGSIFINGEDRSAEGLSCVSARVGLVPQDDILIDELTVRENIAYFHRIAVDSGLSAGEVDARIDSDLAQLGIKKVADTRVGVYGAPTKNISGGQRKRANIAMELINDPDVLIIDEPTSGLSSQDSLDLLKNLRGIADTGKIVVVIIHQPSSEIFQLFDRLLVLDGQGQCVRSGRRDEVMAWFRATGTFSGAPYCGSCGSHFPDRLLEAVEKVGNWQDASAKFGSAFADQALPAPSPVPTNRLLRSPFESCRDFLALVRRQLLIRRRDRMSQLVTFGAPPALGLLMASVFKAAPDGQAYDFAANALYPQALFMLIIGTMFLGLVSSIFEVIKDRGILGRETLRGLSPAAYYCSELVTMAIVGAVQSLLLATAALWSLGALDYFWQNLAVIYGAMLLSGATGLLVSTLSNSAIAAYNMIPLILIPQIILGGALLQYKEMGKEIYLWEKREGGRQPILAKLMPASWAYQMAMRANFDAMQDKESSFNVGVRSLDGLPRGAFLSPQAERLPAEPVRKLLPWHEEAGKAYADDALILALILAGMVGTGLIWIYRDYRPYRKRLWAAQAVLVAGLPGAYPFLTVESANPPAGRSIQYVEPGRPMQYVQARDFCKARSMEIASLSDTIAIFQKRGHQMLPGTYWSGEEANNSRQARAVWIVRFAKAVPGQRNQYDEQQLRQSGAVTTTKALYQQNLFLCTKPPEKT